MNIKLYILKLTALLLLLMFFSCGYHFEGGGYLNKNVTHVSILNFANESTEDEADLIFTNALINEIIDQTDTEIVDDEKAAFSIKGKVKSISFRTLSRSTTETVLERRVTAVLDVQLVNDKGEIVWAVKDFKTNDEYEVSEDQVADETNIRNTLEQIAQRSSEKLVSKMVTNF